MISNDNFQEWFQRRRLGKSFVRWAGGKQPFLSRYGSRIPRFHGRYIEPFLGSGSVFFYIQRTQSRPTDSLLGDRNLQLILTFYAVRDEPKKVFKDLDDLRNRYLSSTDRRLFYEAARASYNANLPTADPATFIFLNRTCWNGLYRTNLNGEFNVPHGTFKGEPPFPTEVELLNASAALQQAQLRASSWENVLSSAVKEDFAFIDPPYYSDVVGNSTKYGRDSFLLDDHKRLIRALVELSKRSVPFMLTNSAEPELVELYKSAGLYVEETSVARSISSDTDRRGSAPEVIVTPKPPLRLA
jgi:DNA adenine methylase